MKQLLMQAREDILSLRRRNEILQAKVDVMDLFACVLNTQPNYPAQGMGEDIAWKLDRAIDEISKQEKADAVDRQYRAEKVEMVR